MPAIDADISEDNIDRLCKDVWSIQTGPLIAERATERLKELLQRVISSPGKGKTGMVVQS